MRYDSLSSPFFPLFVIRLFQVSTIRRERKNETLALMDPSNEFLSRSSLERSFAREVLFFRFFTILSCNSVEEL